MTSLISWLVAGAMAAPGIKAANGFESGAVRLWVEGPPGATVVILAGPGAAPCQPRVGRDCLGFDGPTEVLGTFKLGPGGFARIDAPLRANLPNRLAVRPLFIDGPNFIAPNPVFVDLFAADQDPDGDFVATSIEEQLGLDPNNPDTDGGGVDDGLELGVQGTPTFYVDGEPLQPRTYEDFTSAIDAALASS